MENFSRNADPNSDPYDTVDKIATNLARMLLPIHNWIDQINSLAYLESRVIEIFINTDKLPLQVLTYGFERVIRRALDSLGLVLRIRLPKSNESSPNGSLFGRFRLGDVVDERSKLVSHIDINPSIVHISSMADGGDHVSHSLIGSTNVTAQHEK